ncbi:MAG: asparagine synthase (glutamine-hydrolyzing) [Bryobacteraceae bacterium]
MCGIAGYWLWQGNASEQLVHEMCGRIRYRGPDDEGIHIDGGCGMGMRRLSIIDLSTGHQPMSNEDGTVWIVFNGEIYDYRALRGDLIAQGHRFATHSDTETIIHLYEQEGVEGLSRLRGMFAICLWDSRRRKLVLARDRFGKKPLYYAVLPHGIYFASELKCLATAGVPLEVDEDALRLYFQFSYIPDPYSAYRAVRKLPAGGWLECSGDGSVREGRYWKLPAPAETIPGHTGEAEMATRVRAAFDESVAVRMIADVPLGAFLSGGIDSGSVVASMALQSPEPVKTFSIGFEESAFNELPYAAMVAKMYRTEHHEIVVKPDAISLIQRLVRHFDEPFADTSAIPTFIVSEFAAQHVKVALSGDGGDELFDGYDSLLAMQRLRKLDLIPGVARSLLSWAADQLPYSAYGKNYLRMISRPTALDRYFEFNYTPYFLRKRLLQAKWVPPADAAFLQRMLPHCFLPGDASIVSQAVYFESTANLTGDMLVKVDRMSMANSLEVRCPLLDHHLAELAATIPHAWKLRDGRGKYILRQALGGRLPPALLQRGKMGFGVPLGSWYRGPLREFLWDHLTSKQFGERGIVSPEFLKELLEEHQSGRRDNQHWLSMLLMLELWYRG